MAKKIDPINRKNYGALSIALTVADIMDAITFYQKAFGFKRRSIFKGPDGKPVHAELTLRDTTLMLSPEMPGLTRSAKTFGGSPATLYLYVEDADKVYAKALKLGAVAHMPMTDMFWGDRCGSVIDREGYQWSLATHIAEPTPREMNKKMKEQMESMAPAEAAPPASEAASMQSSQL